MQTTAMPTTAMPTTARVKNDLFDDERVGNIYRTAAQMIYEKGFAATSMSEIAEALRMTKPGLYYYVKGKEELLYAIMSFAMDHLDAEVVEPAQRISDPEQRLRTIVERHALLLMQERRALGILIDEVGGLNESHRDEIVRRKRSYFDLVRGTLDELRRAGRLREVDATVAAFSLLGMVMWTSRWYRADGRLSKEQVAEHLAEVALNGVLLPTPQLPETLST